MLGSSSSHALQGQLLQVHQRDAARPRGAERRERASTSLAALNGTASGGGYELALACDEIVLADDGSSAVSLPEAPLLGVLPGHRRPHAPRRQAQGAARPGRRVLDASPRACAASARVEWGLVDEAPRKSEFEAAVKRAARGDGRAQSKRRRSRRVALDAARAERDAPSVDYQYVTLALDAAARTATLTVRAPDGAEPQTPEELAEAGRERVGPPRVPRARRRAPRLRFNHPGDRRRRPEDAAATRRACSPSTRCSPQHTGRRARARGQLLDEARAQAPRPHGARASSRSSSPGAASPARCSSSRSPPTASTCSTTRERETVARSVSPMNAGPLADGERPHAPADPLPRRARARRRASLEHARAVRREGRARRGPRHLRARRHRLGRRAAPRLRGAREPLARRADRAWRRTCASPGPRRWRPRSSAASRPGRTGSSSGRTRSASAARSRCTASPSGPSSTCETAPERAPMSSVNNERIPNNVDLADDKRLQRALEAWQPNFISWWKEMGPDGLPGGRRLPAHRHQRRPRRLGALRLREDARLPLGHLPRRRRARPHDRLRRRLSGKPVWQEVPGEHRNMLRRLIVTQGDTEPASVEQQRLLGQLVPERLRPAQPLPGERRGGAPPLGDGLPAPLATSAATAARRPRSCSSAAAATPTSRASSARSTSRAPTGSRSSCSRSSPTATASSSCSRSPRAASIRSSRTTRFMLTEEAHHMFVGETGVLRVVERTARADGRAREGPPGRRAQARASSTCRRCRST